MVLLVMREPKDLEAKTVIKEQLVTKDLPVKSASLEQKDIKDQRDRPETRVAMAKMVKAVLMVRTD